MRLLYGLAALALIACGDESDTLDTSAAETTVAPTDTSATETSAETVEATTDTSVTDVSPDVATDTEATETSVTETSVTETEDTVEEVGEVTGDVADDTETSAPTFAGACPLDQRLGGFAVVDDGEYGYVSGEIADAVLPVSVLEVVTQSGGCTLYRKENPFCEPTCSPSDTCNYQSECVPYPLPQELGTVTVTGLEGGDVVMTFGPSYFATELPYPPWTAGAAIALTSTTSPVGALDLDGIGPQTFVVSDTTWTIQRDQALAARWNAPSGAVETQVELQLLIDQHGNAPASVRCNFDDDGEAEVPAVIINALLDSGVSGFPSGKLTRQTVDSVTTGAFCADYAVRAPRNVKVTVSGFTPCTNDNQCPPGQTCNEPIETCVDE